MMLKLIIDFQGSDNIVVSCYDLEDCFLIISLASHRFRCFSFKIVDEESLPFPAGTENIICRGDVNR